LKLDSGSHPKLYKLGMLLYKINPTLWEYGIRALGLPNEVSFKWKLKFGDRYVAKRIETVNLEVTVRCNLRCGMCWWWGESGIAPELAKEGHPLLKEELTTQEIFEVVDQLAPQKPLIHLSGGEPFIREDMIDIIEYISRNGMSMSINTNGTLLSEDKLERISKIGNLTINFSIDGPKEVHDKIRGHGVFDKATSTIRRLLELRGNTIYPSIKTTTTFSPLILGRMDELIRYLQDDVGVDALRMQHVWFTDKAHAEEHKRVLKEAFGTNERGVDSHVVPPYDPHYANELAREIKQAEKSKYSKPVFIHPKLTKQQIVRQYTDLSFKKRHRCFIAWASIIIKANGDVMFCPDEWMTDFKLGNVRNNGIDEMWNGKKAVKFREELYKRRLFPACARCCAINNGSLFVQQA
jgi:radical SAM protein with 4Fe4S-binding SPASM domain